VANPDALDDAPLPRRGRFGINGTTLYAVIRGDGSPVLLIPGGAEDAEGWRAVAERMVGHTVVTYDRRGTLRSGREDWPGRGSAQHADDAAALLGALGIGPAVVFGGSSAGIVATQLAIRHPTSVRRALIYEPGYLRCVPAGVALQASANDAVAAHLDRHAGDWVGAYAAFVRVAVPNATAGRPDVLTPPTGGNWYERREVANAEALVRDDIPILTTEPVDEASLAAATVELRFAHGTTSPGVFREIAAHLAAVRGAGPDIIQAAGHAIYVQPDLLTDYIRAHGET
jgi:pimeloyl-ACP methyl ester carboxylesterase